MSAIIRMCRMNYETVGDKMIFYSLGNFIFDTDYQRAQFNTEKGILLKLHFTEDSYSFEAFGLKINRENEHIESAPLPRIFADIQENDYNKLEPLAAKMFLAATKRQQLFLYPDKFKDATEEQWKAHFYEEKAQRPCAGGSTGLPDYLSDCPGRSKGCLENLQTGGCESLYSGTDVANTSGSGRW